MFRRETNRLFLSELTQDDSALILAVLNDADFIHNVADRGVRTTEEARHYIEQGPMTSYRQNNFGMYKVALKDGTAIGLCGLVKREGLNDVDIGFAYLPEFRGQGYAQEAAQTVMAFAREELRLQRIIAIASPTNGPSIRLLEKLGMRREGHITLPGEEEALALLAWHSNK